MQMHHRDDQHQIILKQGVNDPIGETPQSAAANFSVKYFPRPRVCENPLNSVIDFI